MKKIFHIDSIMPYIPYLLRFSFERIKRSQLGYRLVKGAFWSLIGTAISRGAMLVSFIIVARMVGKELFGQFGIIRSTVQMFGVFAGFGLGLTANKHIAEFRDKDPKKAGRILSLSETIAFFLGGILTVILIFLGPWLAKDTLAAPHLGSLLQIAAFILFFETINGAQLGALAGFEAFKTIAKVNFFVGIATFPLIVGGVYFKGLKGAVWALVIVRILNWLLNHLELRHEAHKANIYFSISDCIKEYHILLSFSIPAFFSNAIIGPVRWGVNALLVNNPHGYSEMGILSAAYSFQQFLIFSTATIGRPLLPIISNELETKNEKLEKVNMISTWIIGVILALFLLAFPEIIQSLFGKEFDMIKFNRTFILLILATSVMIYKQGLARVLQANGMMWWALFSNIFWAIILFLCAVPMVALGSIGISGAILIAYVSNILVFIPLYITKGLVPKKTIVSVEALTIWMVLIIFATMSWFFVSIHIRILLFPIAMIIILMDFKKIFIKKNEENKMLEYSSRLGCRKKQQYY